MILQKTGVRGMEWHEISNPWNHFTVFCPNLDNTAPSPGDLFLLEQISTFPLVPRSDEYAAPHLTTAHYTRQAVPHS